jgi:predicted Rossmann-fold nucleotide-binding protein
MKVEVDSPHALRLWLDQPTAAVFQGLDLRPHDEAMTARLVSHCTFIGCSLGPLTLDAAQRCPTVIIPVIADLPFDGFRHSLYTPDELYDTTDDNGDLDPERCYDRVVYLSYADASRRPQHVPLDVLVMRTLHDAAIHDALDELLDPARRLRTVAVMGGHDVSRTAQVYRHVAELGVQLAAAGYTVMTGGGPGLMEAANLGAFCAGFDEPLDTLATILDHLAPAPMYDHPEWLHRAFVARRHAGPPTRPEISRNIGIPTWFYGHEPPNVFATDVAKFFDNSIRENGLLAYAMGGIVFAEGNGGTVQEIFQDACQNYYATQGLVSPMVLLGVDYWNSREAKPVWPLLHRLADTAGFGDMIALTDDLSAVLPFLRDHPPRDRVNPA